MFFFYQFISKIFSLKLVESSWSTQNIVNKKLFISKLIKNMSTIQSGQLCRTYFRSHAHSIEAMLILISNIGPYISRFLTEIIQSQWVDEKSINKHFTCLHLDVMWHQRKIIKTLIRSLWRCTGILRCGIFMVYLYLLLFFHFLFLCTGAQELSDFFW